MRICFWLGFTKTVQLIQIYMDFFFELFFLYKKRFLRSSYQTNTQTAHIHDFTTHFVNANTDTARQVNMYPVKSSSYEKSCEKS